MTNAEKANLRLECLKIAERIAERDAVFASAKRYYNWIIGEQEITISGSDLARTTSMVMSRYTNGDNTDRKR